VRVRGDTLLTEGQVYAFMLDIAKKMSLVAQDSDAAPTIRRQAVPAFGDSARACLQGMGFSIVLVGAPEGQTCSTKRLADAAQRTWTWNVRPDTVSRAHGETIAHRQLSFTVASFGNNTRDDFTRSFPVAVRIIPPTFVARAMAFLTSTKGLLAELGAVIAAIAGILKLMRRKPSDSPSAPTD
jgi:hypothetical protein